MLLPLSLDNSSPSPRPDSARATPSDVPIKPFRLPPPVPKRAAINIPLLRALYNDKKEVSRALVWGMMIAAIIIGSIVVKTGFTYLSLMLIFVVISAVALTDTWNAVMLFTVYLSLEGMYKYTSKFNQIVYIVAPLLATVIIIAWRLRVQNMLSASKKSAKVSPVPTTSKPSVLGDAPDEPAIPLPKMSMLVAALMSLSLLQCLNPETPSIVTALQGGLVWYTAPMAFFFVSYYNLTRRKHAMGLVYMTLVVGFVSAAYALFQFNMGRSWCYSHVIGMKESVNLMSYALVGGKVGEEGAFRPVGTYAIAGGYVGVAATSLLAALCVGTMPRMLGARRVVALMSVIVTGMAIAVSSVRLSVLTLLAVTPVFLALSVRRLQDAARIYFMTFLIATLLVVSFAIADGLAHGKLTKRYKSTLQNPFTSYQKQRGYHFDSLYKTITIRPLGIGISRTSLFAGAGNSNLTIDIHVLNNVSDRETQWNATQGDMGIFGLILNAALFVGILYFGYQICRTVKDANLRVVASLLYTYILSTIIYSFGGASLQSNYFFWICCGSILAVPRIESTERDMLERSATTLQAGGDITDTRPS